MTCLLCSLISTQVSLLDVNDAAGRTLKEALDKQYGQEKTLFFKCDVESEEQVKGSVRTNTRSEEESRHVCIHTVQLSQVAVTGQLDHANGPLSSSQYTNTGGEPSMSDYTTIGGDIALSNVLELDLSVVGQLCHSSNKQVCPQEICGSDKPSLMGHKNASLLTRHALFSCSYLVTRFFFFIFCFCYTPALFGHCVLGVLF